MTNTPAPLPPADPRNGCLQAFAIVIGMILLLPGICGIILASYGTKELGSDQSGLLIIAGLIAVGICGIVVIWLAVRPRR